MSADCTKIKGRVILIHGFNVRDGGEGSIAKLAPFFSAADFEIKRFRYGWLGFIGVAILDKRFAQILADMVEPGDIVVGHSNGCLIAHLAAHLGAPIQQMVYINPALDSDARLASQVRALHVWHSPSDVPVSAARWLPWHRWGNMGAVGYRGPYDPRVRSYNKENGYPVSSRGHSDVFAPELIRFFGPKIVEAVINASQNPS